MNVSSATRGTVGPSSAGAEEGQDNELPRWQRLLLPAMLGAADYDPAGDEVRRLPRSARDWLVDLALFGFAVMAGVGALATHHSHVRTGLLVLGLVLAIPACLALWVRRRHPVAVGLGTVCLAAVSGGACGAAIVAIFSAAIHARPRRAIEIALLAVPAGALDFAIYTNSSAREWGQFAFWCVVTAVALASGSFVRVRRQLFLSLRERTRRVESEQQLRVREAQLEERARIAREMHDVLAHRISLLSVHAGALEFHPDATPEEIARAASVIRVSARAAQEDLREVIGVLRADPDSDTVRPPQPTLGDVAALVQDSRAAGIEIALVNELVEEQVPILVGRTIYRIVQEGLTNALKHAPGQRVTITIDGDPEAGAHVQLVNRAGVGQALTAERQPTTHIGSGTGLVGLSERVALLGGTLEARPLADAGFELQATIPWPGDAQSEDAEEAR